MSSLTTIVRQHHLLSRVCHRLRGVGVEGVQYLAIAACQQQHSTAASSRQFSDAPKQRTSNVKKKEKKSKTSDTGGRSRDLELLLACLDAPKKPLPEANEEELARREQIMKAYTIGKFQLHNQENHDIACKLRMKKHAINMLPKNSPLKRKALEIDDTDFPPRWRIIPAWTPPITGFDTSEFMITEE